MRNNWIAVLAVATLLSCTKTTDSADAEAGTGGAGTGGVGTGGAGTGNGGRSGAPCSPACGESRMCCIDHCVNLANDPENCGRCGRKCQDGTYCSGGDCQKPLCMTTCSNGTCCASECCSAGQLCCDPQGPIDVTPRCLMPNEHGTCPLGCAPLCMCASPATPIATPEGARPIAELCIGDLIYSVDHGLVRPVPVIRTNRVPVGIHRVIRLRLVNGAMLEISPGHPTADGRRFAELRAGDVLDGVAIDAVSEIPYAHDATYDVLPDSDTGSYFAAGVLIGSTLAKAAKTVVEPTSASSAADGVGAVRDCAP